MIYLTAQPGTMYFFWQLELQLRNLKEIGVSPQNIHVLIGHNSTVDERELSNFSENNKHLGCIYIYHDDRTEKAYISSIRPHIIKKHFEKYSFLETETIVYIDSDVLFERQFNSQLFGNKTCYVSDTKSYLDSDYIVEFGSKELLNDMASIVGISVEKIVQEKENTGGAQYILKDIPIDFWRKVERDATNLFLLMEKNNDKVWEDNYSEKKNLRRDGTGIQAWCADMWAMLWNLWYFNKDVAIHKELDFLWADSPIDEWGSKIILHYTGIRVSDFSTFNKTRYDNRLPWYDLRLANISQSTCSYIVYKSLMNRKKELDEQRSLIDNIAFIFKCKSLNEETIEKFRSIKNYIDKNINVKIYLLYENSIIDKSKIEITDTISYSFLDSLCKQTTMQKYLIFPLGVVVDTQKIYELLGIAQNSDRCVFEAKKIFKIDPLIFSLFNRCLDIEFLNTNTGKFDELNSTALFLILCNKDSLKEVLSKKSIPSDFNYSNKIFAETFFYAP